MKRTLVPILSTVVVLCLAVFASASPAIKVDCNKGGSISATLAHLAETGSTRGITIFVSGTCKENISISRFDRLVLQASPSATLQDASNGNAAVVNIVSSSDVTLQGFEIKGGGAGVVCWYFSFCTLNHNTVQQSSGQGVFFGRSDGLLQGNKIVNNAAHGLTVNASNVETYGNTISNNGASGVIVNTGSLTATSDTITSNGVFGIRLRNNSAVRAFDLTVDGNSAAGVHLESGSTASFEQINTGNVITGKRWQRSVGKRPFICWFCWRQHRDRQSAAARCCLLSAVLGHAGRRHSRRHDELPELNHNDLGTFRHSGDSERRTQPTATWEPMSARAISLSINCPGVTLRTRDPGCAQIPGLHDHRNHGEL